MNAQHKLNQKMKRFRRPLKRIAEHKSFVEKETIRSHQAQVEPKFGDAFSEIGRLQKAAQLLAERSVT